MELQIRHPRKNEGEIIWNLIRNAGNLDLNSSYCYFMLSSYYSETCSVAINRDTNEIIGFVSSMVTPKSDKTLFIWQIAVAKSARKNGISKKMLRFLINENKQISHIETTISPSNTASANLFKSIAKEFNANVDASTFLNENDFKYGVHEAELLYKIGPLKRNI